MASACFYIECPITGLILGVSRKDDQNAWGLPGGKVEPGQTELQAAWAELRQETGIQLYDLPHWYPEIFRREGGVTFQATTGQIRGIYPKAPGETGRVAWVTIEQLVRGPFGDYNRRLLQHIGRIGNEPVFKQSESGRCARCNKVQAYHYGFLYRCEPRNECPSCGSEEHYDDECAR